MELYLRLMQYVKPYASRLGLAIVCIIFSTSANLYVPWIIRDVIDKVLTAGDMQALNMIATGIVIVYLMRGIFHYGQTYLMAFIGQRVVIDIRKALYCHLQRLSLAYFERRQTGIIMSYVTNDVAALQNGLVQNNIDMLTEGMILIGSIGAMFYFHWKLTLLTFVMLPLIAHAINKFGKRQRLASRVMQETTADISSVLQETISGIRVIKSFAREDYEIERFERENLSSFRAQMKAAQISAITTPVVEFLAALGVTSIIWYGGREVIAGNLTSGSLMAFLIYSVNIANPMRRLSQVYSQMQRALAAAQRVFEVMDIVPDIEEIPNATTLPTVNGQVIFDKVTFEYKPNEIVLDQVSFTANPGQMIAIVGPSGAGKTTIANLIPRFYDIKSGRITIDGIDITTVTLSSLREQIGIVPQETVLFNGTIYDNILYGCLTATKEEIIAAAQAANAHNFIMKMPQGYDTQIGERGATLSGGQRQRVSIARAILKDPRILILDEATSALDPEGEKLVQEALDTLMLGRTSFVIAHRLSTVQRANKIMVMNKGKLAEIGTHDELLAVGGVYASLYQVQFRDIKTD